MSSDTKQSLDVGTSKIKLPEVLNKCLTRPRKGKNPYWVDVNSEGSTNRCCKKLSKLKPDDVEPNSRWTHEIKKVCLFGSDNSQVEELYETKL